MALFLYVLIGFIVSSILILTPNAEMKSFGHFFFLVISWLPLFLLGLVYISIHDRNRISV